MTESVPFNENQSTVSDRKSFAVTFWEQAKLISFPLRTMK
jgi:hypothetical protein